MESQTTKVIQNESLKQALIMASLQGFIVLTQPLPEVAMYKHILGLAEAEGFRDPYTIGPSRVSPMQAKGKAVQRFPIATVELTARYALAYLNGEILPKGFMLHHAGNRLLLLAPPTTQSLQ